jgi:hypothetical protein
MNSQKAPLRRSAALAILGRGLFGDGRVPAGGLDGVFRDDAVVGSLDFERLLVLVPNQGPTSLVTTQGVVSQPQATLTARCGCYRTHKAIEIKGVDNELSIGYLLEFHMYSSRLATRQLGRIAGSCRSCSTRSAT